MVDSTVQLLDLTSGTMVLHHIPNRSTLLTSIVPPFFPTKSTNLSVTNCGSVVEASSGK